MVAYFVPPTGGVATPQLLFQATTVQGTATTYTYSSQAIGSVAADRLVIVAVHSLQSVARTITSVTVGGVSATVVPNTAVTITNFFAYRMAFYVAVVPTGATASIVVTMSGSTDGGAISVWSAYNVSATAVDGDSVSGTASPLNIPSVNTSLGGVLVAAGTYGKGVGAGSFSWTSVTERSDISTGVSGTEWIVSGADTSASGAGIAPSATLAGSIDAGVAIAASFG